MRPLKSELVVDGTMQGIKTDCTIILSGPVKLLVTNHRLPEPETECMCDVCPEQGEIDAFPLSLSSNIMSFRQSKHKL
jgi:hypothetical protein